MAIDSVGDSGVSSFTIGGSDIGRYLPEPESGVRGFFGSVLQTLGGAAADIAEPSLAGIDSKYIPFIEAQIHAQEQLQLVSLYSNIEKSRHETQMAAIRNVRVG